MIGVQVDVSCPFDGHPVQPVEVGDRVRLDVRAGDLCWYDGAPVRVRLIGYGIGVPGVAWLTDGRKVPVAELVSCAQVAASTKAVGW